MDLIYKWEGTNSSDWNDSSNWVDGNIPPLTTHSPFPNIEIFGGCAHPPILSSKHSLKIGDLTFIEFPETLTIESPVTANTVSGPGKIILANSTFIIKSATTLDHVSVTGNSSLQANSEVIINTLIGTSGTFTTLGVIEIVSMNYSGDLILDNASLSFNSRSSLGNVTAKGRSSIIAMYLWDIVIKHLIVEDFLTLSGQISMKTISCPGTLILANNSIFIESATTLSQVSVIGNSSLQAAEEVTINMLFGAPSSSLTLDGSVAMHTINVNSEYTFTLSWPPITPFTKIGGGTLNLEGSFQFSSPITIESGTLALNGSIILDTVVMQGSENISIITLSSTSATIASLSGISKSLTLSGSIEITDDVTLSGGTLYIEQSMTIPKIIVTEHSTIIVASQAVLTVQTPLDESLLTIQGSVKYVPE